MLLVPSLQNVSEKHIDPTVAVLREHQAIHILDVKLRNVKLIMIAMTIAYAAREFVEMLAQAKADHPAPVTLNVLLETTQRLASVHLLYHSVIL